MKHLLLAKSLKQANAYRLAQGLPGRDTHNVVTHINNLRDAAAGCTIHVLPDWHTDRPDWEIDLVTRLVSEAQRKGAVIHK